MKFAQSFLVALACSGPVFTAQPAYADDSLPTFVTNLTGTLQVSQNIPCNNQVNVTTPVSGGSFTLTPATGLDVNGGKQFSLVGATITFAPFSASGSCHGFSGSQNYTAVGVQLVDGVTFVATPIGTGVYNLTIPKSAIQFYEGSIVNNNPENGYLTPAQDVTGTIDLAHSTASVHVVINTSVHFKECFIICLIDETDSGTLTADVSGTLALPDADGDGVPDILDNCPFIANPDQSILPASPTVAPPANLTLPTCTNTQQFGLAFAADACFGGPVTLTNNAPAQFAIGANAVLWSATESSDHRSASATQTVTVIDTTPPVFTFVPPGILMNTCGPANLGTATATDDCAGPVAITNNAPSYFFVGATTVTWTAKDVSGNTTLASQLVTVIDTTPPTVSCTPVEPPGIAPAGNTFQVAASDACGPPVTRLGGVVLGNNEIVKIVETGTPGVRFVGTVGPDNIRFFQVGMGEAIIVATDGSGNVSSAVCIK